MEKFKEFMYRKHTCSIPGCRNRDVVRIARTTGALGALFVCRDCAAQVFAQLAGVDTEGFRDLTDVAYAVAFAYPIEQKGETDGEK